MLENNSKRHKFSTHSDAFSHKKKKPKLLKYLKLAYGGDRVK